MRCPWRKISTWQTYKVLTNTYYKYLPWNDCNGTRTHNHFVRKQTLNHLAKLTKWFSWIVSTYLYGGTMSYYGTKGYYFNITTSFRWVKWRYTCCILYCIRHFSFYGNIFQRSEKQLRIYCSNVAYEWYNFCISKWSIPNPTCICMKCVHGLGKETSTKSVIYWNSKWSLLTPKKSSWANWL